VAQIADAKIEKVSVKENMVAVNDYEQIVSIRVSPNSYLAAFFVITFSTGFLVYLQKDIAAALLCLANWTLIPFLAFNDKIVFDGESIFRTGFLPKLLTKINGSPKKLKISQIEQVETQAQRALKRGGNIFYRYRTAVQGSNLRFSFASGGEDYRQMVEKLFRSLPIDVLDNRSIELRDYLSEPKEILMKAAFSKIPSTEVLENSFNNSKPANKNSFRKKQPVELTLAEIDKADELRLLANELRLSGNLVQSLEAFRRALFIKPLDAWLIFEFARCLHSYAGIERDKTLIHRANAALRLAELRAGNDKDLLARIGESYFQYGKWNRARLAFNRALSGTNQNFRAVRGLAEIALREGKIAHVIHHFATAIHLTENVALRRWAQNETDYFSRLNSDEEYIDAEVTRINRLEKIERWKVTAMRLTVLGIAIVLIGLVIAESIALLGWTFSTASLITWIALITSRRFLIKRSPLAESED
jgi:hypothetical protein